MSTENIYKWEFSARFRKGCFGWRSDPAISRIKEAVAEIGKVAHKDQILGAAGAVLFLEKLSPALERVDSSSGAIGTAVNNAIEKLTPTIAKAPEMKSCVIDGWNDFGRRSRRIISPISNNWPNNGVTSAARPGPLQCGRMN